MYPPRARDRPATCSARSRAHPPDPTPYVAQACRTGAPAGTLPPAEPTPAALAALTWISKSVLGGAPRGSAQYALCVDPTTDRTCQRAERLQLLGYPLEWCVKAVDEAVHAIHKAGLELPDDDDDEDNENGHAPNGHAKALPDVLVKAADWLQTHAPPPASATR